MGKLIEPVSLGLTYKGEWYRKSKNSYVKSLDCKSVFFLQRPTFSFLFFSFSNINLFIYSFKFFYFLFFYFTILYWFCHTSACIHHRCTRVPHPEPPSPYQPSGSSQCTIPKLPVFCIEPGLAIHFLYDIIHVLTPFSQITTPPPQSPKDCSIQLCLFCCLAYRVNVTIFLNSIYMR